jgi:uncharacterized membrane protein YvbJ
MAIIKCNECGKDYSDKAHACPNCGCPTMSNLTRVTQISDQELANSSTSESNSPVESSSVDRDKGKSFASTKNISILALILLLIVGAIYIYDDQQREIDYRMRYEAAMDNYNDQMTLYNQCLSNLNDSNISTGSVEYTMALIQCKNIKPNLPFIIRRDRIFKIPFVD